VVAEVAVLITEFMQVVNNSLVAVVQAVEGLETVELVVEAEAKVTPVVEVAELVTTTKVELTQAVLEVLVLLLLE
jgi:hypothetical protein